MTATGQLYSNPILKMLNVADKIYATIASVKFRYQSNKRKPKGKGTNFPLRETPMIAPSMQDRLHALLEHYNSGGNLDLTLFPFAQSFRPE